MATTPPGAPTPQQIAQMWEAGAKALTDGLRQAQEFWGSAAKSWGDVAGGWMSQFSRAGAGPSPESQAVLRELQEAAFTVGQAWMRLPLALTSGGQPGELQAAIMRLTEAQGRAYKLWLEALRAPVGPPGAPASPTGGAGTGPAGRP